MSHGQPLPQPDMFGFGALGMGVGAGVGVGMGVGMEDLDGVSTEIPSTIAAVPPGPAANAIAPPASQMGSDAQGMMPLMDNSLFAGFDHTLPMNLDSPDDMAAAGFNPILSGGMPNAPPAIIGTDAQIPTQAIASNPALEDPMPLPAATGSTQGPPSNLPGGTLTEFTKRRNWSAKVIEELKDLLQILDANGRIRQVSQSITALTGYTAEEVSERFLRDFIHPDDTGLFTAELNESIATGHPLRLFYRLRKKDGKYAIFEAVGHAHIAAARFAPNPNNQSPFCQAVFVMSRPYPTKNASLLDSFLEHKMENERLRRRIAELRKEEEDDVEQATRAWRQSQEGGRSDITPSEDNTATNANNIGAGSLFHQYSDHSSMPPAADQPLNIALTRENLEGVAAGSRTDSIRDKMARYEGTQADTIEMLTGLRYQEGERSRGITTGNASPTLIKGDAGIAIPVDRDPRTGEKKKKLKVAEEYVCTDCGTLDSPEWRKGPSGPKTLCNACGLRWAKKEKKKKNQKSVLGGGMSALPSLVDHSGN